MPTWFIPHGAGPCFFMEWNPEGAWHAMAHFLRGIAQTLPEKPKAVVMVSAHWLSSNIRVTGATRPDLIYDYSGFPSHTYALKYPAVGDPQLARRILQQLETAQISAAIDPTRGFDHGMFIPLMLIFPEADTPVVQVSLNQNLDPKAHYQLGEAMASLREDGVLIIGSGMSFHNMRGYGDPRFGPLSDEFDAWLKACVEMDPLKRKAMLIAWANAPQARLCHPEGQEEHLLPLMVVAGAAPADPGLRVFSDRVLETTLSAYVFGG